MGLVARHMPTSMRNVVADFQDRAFTLSGEAREQTDRGCKGRPGQVEG